jgi:hypothetical protein
MWRLIRIGDHADPDAFERLTFWSVFLLVATSALTLAGWLLH